MWLFLKINELIIVFLVTLLLELMVYCEHTPVLCIVYYIKRLQRGIFSNHRSFLIQLESVHFHSCVQDGAGGLPPSRPWHRWSRATGGRRCCCSEI